MTPEPTSSGNAQGEAPKGGRRGDGRVLHYLLAERARRMPEKPFLIAGDRVLSYRDAEEESNRWAHGLAGKRVGRGDRVLLMIPSGIEHVLVWFALCKLGALVVPVNEAYRGAMLRHQANGSGAEFAIVAAGHAGRWADLAAELPKLKEVALFPEAADPPPTAPWAWISAVDLRLDDARPLPPVVAYSDPMAIFYTSGTTGPSKGVLYVHAQAYATAALPAQWCDESDVFYMFLPMFHVGLSQMVGLVLIAGATMAIRERFSASAFWSDVRRYRATMTILLSTMPNFLMSQPPRADDRGHPLRKAMVIPLPSDLNLFVERFGVKVATFFNMTEVSVPIHSDGFVLANGTSAGRPRQGVSARIVDENDEPVSAGEVGELVLRADSAWEFSLGYWNNPEKTVESRRNLWFHTGDAFRADVDGNFYFVDRLKDTIRRRARERTRSRRSSR
jgi:crotonobetaine/carnitine-CoA ligase